MHRSRIALAALVLSTAVTAASVARAAEYDIDTAHTHVGFSIRHIVSKVKGQFNEFTGTFRYDPKAPEKSSVQAVIQAKSIDTNMPKRDDHLRSADFFDVAKHPTITFKSTSVKSIAPGKLEVTGDFSLHGVTKPVALLVQGGELAKDPWGGTRTGFTASTTLNRKDYGIVWNSKIDNGGFVLGDDITIELEIEGIQKK